MSDYPKVIGEFDTVRAILTGKSLARLGDGEIKHCDGVDGGRQVKASGLKYEMRAVLKEPHPNLCVGVPTMDPDGPKFVYKNPNGSEGGWLRHRDRFRRALSPDVQYYSAFVSRPDSAPWIYTKAFAELYQSAWAGKRTLVLGPKQNKVVPLAKMAASSVISMLCPHQNAYEFIDQYEKNIVDMAPDIALLSCGPTATVLAHRLCKRGVQAIDFGSGAIFLIELLTDKPRPSSLASYKAWLRRTKGKAA